MADTMTTDGCGRPAPWAGTRVLGIAGWSGSGKTTLLARLIPELVDRGLRIATLKHAHHAFDVDVPGKDSWRHREAGAGEVIVASARRWVLMHELRAAPEPSLEELLQRFGPCELILVEGYKHLAHPKLEVHRPSVGKPLLFPDDPAIVAVATDAALESPPGALPVLDLNDLPGLAAAVMAHALPLPEVLARLRALRPG